MINYNEMMKELKEMSEKINTYFITFVKHFDMQKADICKCIMNNIDHLKILILNRDRNGRKIKKLLRKIIKKFQYMERSYLERLYEDIDETFNKIFSGDSDEQV